MKDKIGIRVGEALVSGGPPGTTAEPEVIIGDLDGPFGTAFASLVGNQVAGHTRVLALLNSDVMVRPATLCVSKVTVTDEAYTNILMGTVQYATAMGVLDAVKLGDIPINKVNDIGIIISIWLNPAVATIKELNHRMLFQIHREATSRAIQKAMTIQPSVEWLIKNQERIIHKYFAQFVSSNG